MATAGNPEHSPPSSILYPHPIILAGPTAVGKSDIALRLAERVDGEIVSVDSMQVYRGMDIGTAKPSPGDRVRVPHHLVDVRDVTEPFDAAQFLELARRAVTGIQGRGRVPILCGGTGLYFKAMLGGLSHAPPTDSALRAALAATPLPELLSELAEHDPETYQRIDRRNPRRVIRAIAVIRLTGRPYSAQRADWQASSLPPRQAFLCFGLTRTPADLLRRIDARVEEMFRRGIVAETEHLLRHGLAQNQNAMQALGYRQVAEHLRGERSLAETIALVKIRTRQYAKRQMTWFRRQLQLTWVHLQPETGAEDAANSILALSSR
jgi:tRNA dimethylallyltransferase